MTARLIFLVFRDDARAPSLPPGSPFRCVALSRSALPGSWIADLQLVSGEQEGERWRAAMLERCSANLLLLSAVGDRGAVFGAARAALQAVLTPGGGVVDVLARRLFDPAVAGGLDWSDPELLVRVETGWEATAHAWVATRGLTKLGLDETSVLVERTAEGLHEGTLALVESIGQHLATGAPDAPVAPGSRLVIDRAAPDSAVMRAHATHLETIAGLLQAAGVAIEPRVRVARVFRGAADVTAVEAARLRDAIRAGESDDEVGDRAEWERAWSEREDLLRAAYAPPGDAGRHVLAVPPAHSLRQRFPGLCVHVFEPVPERGRADWLFVTHGPWQEASSERATYEFGMLAKEPAEWIPTALLAVLAYSLAAEPRLDRGQRLGFALLREPSAPGGVRPLLPVDPETLDDRDEVVGDAAALVLWPTLDPWDGFTTAGGDKLHILIATAVTRGELDFARKTTTRHLLLLLHLAGVGQTTGVHRACVATDPGTAELRRGIERLSPEEAYDALYGRFARGEPPPTP